MYINFKNFNCKAETELGTSIEVVMKTKISLKFNVFHLERNTSPFIEIPLFDTGALKAEAKKFYNKCIKIGLKDTYTVEEQKLINNFFGLSSIVNMLSPNVHSTLKASKGFTNITDEDSPTNFLIFDGYAVGFENVRKLCSITTETGLEDKSYGMEISPLTEDELKKFVSYLKKSDFESFHIALWSVKK